MGGASLTHPWIGPRPLVGHAAVCVLTLYTLRFCSPTKFLRPNLRQSKMASRTRLSFHLHCHGFKARVLKFHSHGEPGDEARLTVIKPIVQATKAMMESLLVTPGEHFSHLVIFTNFNVVTIHHKV